MQKRSNRWGDGAQHAHARYGCKPCPECGALLDPGERCDCQTAFTQLTEALLKEIERVREAMSSYQNMTGGDLAVALMQRDIDTACEAMRGRDTLRMVTAYQALQQWTKNYREKRL